MRDSESEKVPKENYPKSNPAGLENAIPMTCDFSTGQ